MEVETFANTNEEIDMRTVPPAIRKNIIHDEEVLKMRWDLCSGCEFLTEKKSCSKCGCYMAVAHKLKSKSCPIGLWPKHTEEATYGIQTAT